MSGWRQFSDFESRDKRGNRGKSHSKECIATPFIPSMPFIPENKSQSGMVAEWCHGVLECKTTAEYFAVMREFRTSNPTDDDIVQIYRIAGLKLSALKGGGTHINDELTRRTSDLSSRSPEAVPTAPLSITQARALKRKYEATSDAWERFWIWIGKQVEGGATAEFIEESEQALWQAREEHTTNEED